MKIQLLPVLAAVLAVLPGSGCSLDIQPTLPPVVTEFQYPLPPLLPIATDLLLPSIDLCSTASEEAIAEALATVPLGGLLASWLQVERLELVQAVMDGTAPPNASFEGFSEVSILEAGNVLLTATAGNGIEGSRITLRPIERVNLWESLEACPERPSELTVRARGFMPLSAPTRWETRITLRLAVRISPF